MGVVVVPAVTTIQLQHTKPPSLGCATMAAASSTASGAHVSVTLSVYKPIDREANVPGNHIAGQFRVFGTPFIGASHGLQHSQSDKKFWKEPPTKGVAL